MAIANVQLSIFSLVSMQNTLQAQLMKLTQKRQNISTQMSELITTTDWTTDPQVKLLQIQDNDLDMQQGTMETQLSAITANLQSQEKLLDNNIKNDFGANLSL